MTRVFWRGFWQGSLQGVCVGTFLALVSPDLNGWQWAPASLSLAVLVNSPRLIDRLHG